MENQRRRPKYILALCAVALVSASAVGLVATQRRAGGRPYPNKHITDRLPPVRSLVKSLEVVSATIERQGKPSASLLIKIRNKSGVPVTGYTVAFDEMSVGHDGGLSTDEPVTIIDSYGTTTMDIPLGNFQEDVPIEIVAALFADGTEEGLPKYLKYMRRERAREKEKRDAQEGAPEP